LIFSIGSRNSPIESGTAAGSVPATVTGDALKLVPVNRQASIDIELPNNADLSEVTVTVTGVYNEKINDKISVQHC
jgi:hypothetical protein